MKYLKYCSVLLAFLVLLLSLSLSLSSFRTYKGLEKKTIEFLRKDIIARADKVLYKPPQTITSFIYKRSAGGIHDFFSEADYFWPDPANPEAPYIQRDGMSNPDNFHDHRKAMIRLSQIIGSLASAYKVTGDEKFVKQAFIHLQAWFVDTSTRMNPSQLFGADRFNVEPWFNTWCSLEHYPKVEEVIRNLPVRNPVIWLN